MNAILLVAVGQCGNQLCDELLTQLDVLRRLPATRAGEVRASQCPFFASDGKARVVLVDSEPKVVRGVQSRHASFIRAESVVCGQSGRGNNWGLGYYGVNDPHSHRSEHKAAGAQRAFRNLARGQREEDDSTLGKALRAIHMETRRTTDCHTFEAIVVLHSLAGGTGSGLASRLCEKIRLYFVDAADGGMAVDELYEDRMRQRDGLDGMLVDKRRARYLLTFSVAPQARGELATQGINAALTLRVLMRSTDAIVMLRNDDALSPVEATSGSSGAADAGLVPRCITFREANEVLVSLLLPMLLFGGDSEGGVLGPVVRQCVPSPLREANVARTGGNKLLTLVPTPQRVYGRFRECVLRGRFYALHGGRDYLGGSHPSVPVADILTRTARLAIAHTAGLTPSPLTPSARQRQVGGAGAGGRSARPVVPRGARTDGQRGFGRRAVRRVDHEQAWSFGGDQSDPEEGDSTSRDQPEHACAVDSGELDAAAEQAEGSTVFMEVPVNVPAALNAYYKTLRKAPVAKLYQLLEGVLVLNQVRELDEALLFPLLRSAALKVRLGAFLAPYEDVGVSSEDIVKAYRELAETLSFAEEL